MSLNFRKRPGTTILEDITSNKRPKLDDKNIGSDQITKKEDPEFMGDDPRELSNEEISLEEDDDSTDDDEPSSDDENYFDFKNEMKTLQKKHPELHKSLEEVHEEIQKTEPNVLTLFKTPLRLEDRAKLCQFYEIYQSTQPNTLEWLDARMRYNALFKEYQLGYKHHQKFSSDEHEKMKQEEKKLSSYNPQLTLKYKILNLETSQENKVVVYRRYEDLQALEGTSEEYSKLKHWLNWATSIPHDKIKKVEVSNITEFIVEASKKLDAELFGMKKVKEQILLFLSAKLTHPKLKRSNLGLIGPPGSGKTKIARMIAKLMNWGFEQISLGGVDKADFLKGHDYTYVGSQPGAIVKALGRMGHKNGVIFFDELEKAAENPDVRAALLHLVDQSQNHEFRDNFLGDITIDLSHIWYVGSMNSKPKDAALADRWWIIEVPGYNLSEKITIVQNYLLPKILKSLSLSSKDVTIDTHTCEYFIKRVCKDRDKGVRTIQKSVGDIINKINFLVTHQDSKGKLPFSTTFKMKKKLNYPVKLTNQILDKLVASKELNMMLNMMYL